MVHILQHIKEPQILPADYDVQVSKLEEIHNVWKIKFFQYYKQKGKEVLIGCARQQAYL